VIRDDDDRDAPALPGLGTRAGVRVLAVGVVDVDGGASIEAATALAAGGANS
jgi:hypothetical protein